MALAAVIIHFGDLSSTSRFAQETVERSPGVRFFLVNNGPDSDTAVRDAVPSEITVVGPPVNRGYSNAANLGIEAALSSGFDDVVILPDDGEVPAGALTELVQAAADSGATIAGPLVLYQGSRTVWAAGHNFSTRWGISRNNLKGHEWHDQKGRGFVEYVTGHAPLLRGVSTRPWLRFDEDLFIYYEDLSICDEVRRHGERVLFASDVVVFHDKPGDASYRFAATQEKHMARSGLIYWAKHTRGLERITHLFGFAALTVYRLARSSSLAAAKAGLTGLWVGGGDAIRVLAGRDPSPARL